MRTTELEAQAKEVRAKFERDVAAVESRGFTPDVEKAQIADLYLTAHAQIDDLREQHAKAARNELSTAQRRVYGAEDLRAPGSDPATHTVSYRDAQDRAEAAADSRGEQGLSSLLDRALASGDRLLARAVAAHAAQRGHAAVVAAYEEQDYPGFSDLVAQAREDRRMAGMARTVRFRLPKPNQISDMAPHQMTALIERVNADLEQRAANKRPRYSI